MQITRISSIACIALGLVASLVARNRVNPVNKTGSNVALQGYDTVAYFSQGKPVKGSAEFTADWNGATWRFVSIANRDEFRRSPERYAPQFGGYCAWAVGHNYTASIDPEAWQIVDGKLYLNYSKSVQQKWEQDRSRWIVEGDKHWPELHQ